MSDEQAIQSPAIGTEMPEYVATTLANHHRIMAQFPTAPVPPDVQALLWLADTLKASQHDGWLWRERSIDYRHWLDIEQTKTATLQEAAGRQDKGPYPNADQCQLVWQDNGVSFYVRIENPSPSGASA